MKSSFAYFINLILLFSIHIANGQQNLQNNTTNYWSNINERIIPNSGTRYIVPNTYRATHLNINLLKDQLKSIQVLELTQIANASYEFKVPLPDGGYKSFYIAETPILEKPLAIKYPDIKTYSGFDSDANGWYLKMDITSQGFHAMILRPKGQTIFIDPYSFGGGDTEHYISYYRKDYASSVTKTFSCDVIGNSGKPQANSSFKNFGSCELRTYRLAVSATGEYTSFHGGTVANAQAAQTTTMNRVNGVYERDMAITMVFVANNDLLIYTNSGSDPFSNGNPGAMINENQTIVDNIIGSGNYDIGHVFGTNSGGLAGLGVVCNNSQKARGVTGSSAPVGDSFDIDYVAHEMGHQFDANHCFNNSCGGNRNNATAMEPGSGATIMGYAGICAPNIQNNSDDYFHGVNLEEISDFVTGGGHTCPVVTALSNDAPTITSTNGNVTIPASTPFALTAVAVDTNVADVLTYCWEQMDNDISTQSPVSTSNSGPNFRSIDPLTSPTRYFPNLTDLMAGGPFTWEVLPSVSRSMDFRVTVRDNAIGGSCSDHIDVTVSVDASTGPFLVTYPNASGIVWSGGSSQTVTWDVAGTDGGGVNCANVDIFLSTDGGLTWTTTLSSNVANDGSQTVIVPNTPTTTALVMVMCSDGTFFDISDNEFEITGFVPAPPVANFQADVTTTCTGEVQFTDLSTNVPTSWLWDFGDGGSSTQQNPLHIYTTAGTYSVELTVTNTFGSDDVLFTSYITITKPAAPATTSASFCGAGSLTLTASGSNTLNWYDDSLGTNLVSTGTSFTTPVLTTTTSYFVEEEVPGPIQNVGPTDNSFGNGGNFNNGGRHLVFDAFSDFLLESVWVDADGAGNRTIELRNSNGTIIKDTTINIPDGQGRITLNFDVSPGTDYQLGVTASSNPSLFRNNQNVNYPYAIANLVSITQSNANNPANFYYFFYDWEIREPGCTSEPSEVIATINDEPITTINLDNGISCAGSCDGIISAAITGGSPTFTYAWSNGQTSSSISGLCAATYNVTVTDGNGCSGNNSIIVVDPPGGNINVSTTKVDASCGASDGEATATPNNGSAPYSYLWSDMGAQTTATAVGLAAGNYYVTVTDAGGCNGIDSVSIYNTLPTISSSVTNVSCNGNNDGTASTVPSGGNVPYTYLWNDLNNQTTSTAIGLTAGIYYVTVTDNQGCVKVDTVTITQPNAISLTLSGTDETCAGNDGTTTAIASGGIGTLTYLWNDPGNQNTPTANNLSSGTYEVTITDGNNCTLIDSVSINTLSGPSITVQKTDASCGNTNGSAIVNATGGSIPYTYNWSNGQTGNSISGLSAGSYIVTVTDASNCSENTTFVIIDAGSPIVTLSNTDVSCSGFSDGEIAAIVVGGTTPYTYAWDNTGLSTNSSINGLTAGTYSVTITDFNGCLTSSTATIIEQSIFSTSIISSDVSCFGACNGNASVSIAGGNGSYTYAWNDPNNQNGAIAMGLCSGSYSVTIEDSLGCQVIESISIGEPNTLSLTVSSNNGSCGIENGSATTVVTGGMAPYIYNWNYDIGNTSSSAASLSTGTYTVLVTDSNNCPTTEVFTIDNGIGIEISVSGTLITCEEQTGTSEVTTSGGTSPYTFLWSNGETSEYITGLSEGNYQITVFDANNCIDTEDITIESNGDDCFHIPTGFTPNYDGTNDKWNIKGASNYPDINVEVFNRWGTLIFGSKGYTEQWDGTYNGKELPSAVYYYIITLDQETNYSGSLTIFR